MIGDGTAINRDAIGTRVTIPLGDPSPSSRTTLTREVKASRGTYNSMDTRTLYFGLGDLGCAFFVDVRWPDGTTERFAGTQTQLDRIVTIRYGAGIE